MFTFLAVTVIVFCLSLFLARTGIIDKKYFFPASFFIAAAVAFAYAAGDFRSVSVLWLGSAACANIVNYFLDFTSS